MSGKVSFGIQGAWVGVTSGEIYHLIVATSMYVLS